MKLKESGVKRPRLLRAAEMTAEQEQPQERFFDYERDLNPEVRQAIEKLALYFLENVSSPNTGVDAFAASLFLRSIGHLASLDKAKLFSSAQNWKRNDDRMFPERTFASRMPEDWLRTVATYISLHPDTKVLFEDGIEKQRKFLSPQALAHAHEHTRRTCLLSAMVFYPEWQTEYLALQNSWASQEVKKLEEVLRSRFIQESEFWRPIGDVLTAPEYLTEWRRIMQEYLQKEIKAINFGVKPKGLGELYSPGEMHLVYVALLVQALNGFKFEVDLHGKASLEPVRKPAAANRPLPERKVA